MARLTKNIWSDWCRQNRNRHVIFIFISLAICMAGQGIARLSQVDIAQVVSGTLLMFPDSIQIILLLYTLTRCGI